MNNSKKILINQFDKNTDDLINVSNKYRKKIYFFKTLNLVNVILFCCITLLLLNYKLVNGIISIGLFTSIFTASNSFRRQLASLLKELPNYISISLNGSKIRNFFNSQALIEEATDEQILSSDSQVFDIRIKNVSFSYDGEHEILKKLNLHIPAKGKIAIVDENGVGKTTITKLLLRLYDVDSGEILINNASIKNYKLDEYRLNIGTSFQKNVDSSLSVRENMEFYNQIEDTKIQEIFSLIGYDKVINKNNASYDTLITKEFSSDGFNMSGGEKQFYHCVVYLLKNLD